MSLWSFCVQNVQWSNYVKALRFHQIHTESDYSLNKRPTVLTQHLVYATKQLILCEKGDCNRVYGPHCLLVISVKIYPLAVYSVSAINQQLIILPPALSGYS